MIACLCARRSPAQSNIFHNIYYATFRCRRPIKMSPLRWIEMPLAAEFSRALRGCDCAPATSAQRYARHQPDARSQVFRACMIRWLRPRRNGRAMEGSDGSAPGIAAHDRRPAVGRRLGQARQQSRRIQSRVSRRNRFFKNGIFRSQSGWRGLGRACRLDLCRLVVCRRALGTCRFAPPRHRHRLIGVSRAARDRSWVPLGNARHVFVSRPRILSALWLSCLWHARLSP